MAPIRPFEDSDLAFPLRYSDLVHRQPSALDAEQRLLWAILEDALGCYLASMERATFEQRREFAEVRQWFVEFTEDGRGAGPFSFQTICARLDIDPERLLEGLHAVRARGVLMRHPDGAQWNEWN